MQANSRESQHQSVFSSASPNVMLTSQHSDGLCQRRNSQQSSGYSSLENCVMPTCETYLMHYTIGKVIGKGNFSVVKKAEHLLTNMPVAIKIVDKSKLSSHDLGRVSREVNILKHLRHPHITKMYQVVETTTHLYMVMEYVPCGELFDYVQKNGKFSEPVARQKFCQLLNAVDYCHSQGVVHRDLKMENILLDSQLNVKLADFGFGNYFNGENLLQTFCGSPPYAAPEIFQGMPYHGVKSDIWSLGVILYCMVVGAMPFEQPALSALRMQVLSGKFRVPYWISLSCDNLMRSMLKVQPERRATIAQIREHPWMVGCDPGVHSQPVLATFTPTQQLNVNLGSASLPFSWHPEALEIMSRYGHSRQLIAELLHRKVYDHVMAHYLLLCDYLSASSPSSSSVSNASQGHCEKYCRHLSEQMHHMRLHGTPPSSPLMVGPDGSAGHVVSAGGPVVSAAGALTLVYGNTSRTPSLHPHPQHQVFHDSAIIHCTFPQHAATPHHSIPTAMILSVPNAIAPSTAAAQDNMTMCTTSSASMAPSRRMSMLEPGMLATPQLPGPPHPSGASLVLSSPTSYQHTPPHHFHTAAACYATLTRTTPCAAVYSFLNMAPQCVASRNPEANQGKPPPVLNLQTVSPDVNSGAASSVGARRASDIPGLSSALLPKTSHQGYGIMRLVPHLPSVPSGHTETVFTGVQAPSRAPLQRVEGMWELATFGLETPTYRGLVPYGTTVGYHAAIPENQVPLENGAVVRPRTTAASVGIQSCSATGSGDRQLC